MCRRFDAFKCYCFRSRETDNHHAFAECNCSLAAHPTARRFLYPQLNKFLADVFEGIPTGTQLSGLPKVIRTMLLNAIVSMSLINVLVCAALRWS